MPNEVQRSEQPRRRKKRRIGFFGVIGRILAVLIMICTITGCIVASVLTVYVLNTLDSSDRIVLDSAAMSYTTIIYAEDDKTGEYVELQRVQNSENRIWVDYDQIPQAMKDAAVAVEDKRFWSHSGIDFIRTIHAVINYLNPASEEVFGGSTITQQVVKNVTDDDEFRVDRKVREIFRAINLEKNYTKEQILETYLNTIALGSGTNGVQSAANLYFGKDVSELTPAECASIIAITQNPSKWSPFLHPENNIKRQQDILYFMSQQTRPDGTPMLTEKEYEAASNQELVFQEENYVEHVSGIQNWFIDTVYEEVLEDLVNKAGYTEAGALEALRTEGLRIYTTVDPDMQEYLEAAYVDESTFPTINNAEYPESAFVILDLEGQIKAIVGSNREKEGARVFNRATSAVRQPGSSIKPLSTYSLALEYDIINYSTIFDDAPIIIGNSDYKDGIISEETLSMVRRLEDLTSLINPEKPEEPIPLPYKLWPNNSYNAYNRHMPVVEAIQRSTNTIAVKIVQTLTPRASYDFLTTQLGFTSPISSDADLAPMAIGAMTNGVTPLEMAAGYQIFGNGGLYYEPHSYTEIRDAEGNVILQNKIVPKRVISLETATVMNELLQRVTDSSPGTGTRARFNTMPVAGKTGTSQNDENQWFIGVTPYYVGACWLGYDIAQTIDYRGHYYPPPIIWRTIMENVHSELDPVDFTFGHNANVVELNYCKVSGLLFNEETCSAVDPSTGLETNRAVGYYKTSAMPSLCEGDHEFEIVEYNDLLEEKIFEYFGIVTEEEEEDEDNRWSWDWDDEDDWW